MITGKKRVILSKAFTAGTTVSSLFKMNKTVFAESENVLDWAPIKFCVNNNPSSNNRIVDCGAIRLDYLYTIIV